MFEAKLAQASLLKKVLDSINSLIDEGTWDCSDSGDSFHDVVTSHSDVHVMATGCLKLISRYTMVQNSQEYRL